MNFHLLTRGMLQVLAQDRTSEADRVTDSVMEIFLQEKMMELMMYQEILLFKLQSRGVLQ